MIQDVLIRVTTHRVRSTITCPYSRQGNAHFSPPGPGLAGSSRRGLLTAALVANRRRRRRRPGAGAGRAAGRNSRPPQAAARPPLCRGPQRSTRPSRRASGSKPRDAVIAIRGKSWQRGEDVQVCRPQSKLPPGNGARVQPQ